MAMPWQDEQADNAVGWTRKAVGSDRYAEMKKEAFRNPQGNGEAR